MSRPQARTAPTDVRFDASPASEVASPRFRAMWSALAVILVLASAAPACAQGSKSTQSGPDDSSENGWGMIGRTGHLAFKTFGRDNSITPVELMPYLIQDEHFFFGDFRGFVSNEGLFGGNAGLGYRYLDDGMLSWYGGSLWYDGDNTSGLYFQQVGLSLEAAIEMFELRSNMYLPVGDTDKQFSTGTFASRFQGNQLLFDSTSRYGNAMKGIDFEVGGTLPVPVGYLASKLRGFLGGYYFSGNSVDNITGFKARAELVVNNAVTTQVLYTNDGTFGSNVMVGAQVEFPWGKNHPSSSWKRALPTPYRYVERNYNVIVGETRSSLQNVVAINPDTGLPYDVEHVTPTGTAGGHGSPANGFATVAQAQAAGGNLIFVHTGTTLNENITIQNGQFVLGEGTSQKIIAQGYGPIALPGSPAPGPLAALPPNALPVLNGVNGPAVTMGNHSTFSGFQLQNITGNGIVANGKSDFTIRDVNFTGISGDGIRLTNSSGTVALDNLAFDTTAGRGIVIDGGTATVTASATFSHIGGDAFTVQNTTDGTVTLTDVEIDHASGRGLVGTNLGSTLTTSNLTISQITGDAIVINGSTESVTLGGITSITNSSGRGVLLNNLDPTEETDVTKAITIDDLRITSSSTGAAFSILNSDGDLTVGKLAFTLQNGEGLVIDNSSSVTINNGTISTTGAAGVDITDSNTAIVLQSLSVDGGPVGLSIVDSTGSFVVNGKGTLQSGGIIQNTVNAAIIDNAGTVGLRYMDYVTNTNGITSSSTDYVVLDYLRIGSTTHYAVDSRNDSLHSISNSLIASNGSLGEGSVRYRVDTFGNYTAQITDSTITDNNGNAISIQGLAGSHGASLNFLMDSDAVTVTRGGASALLVSWDGPVGLTMTGTEFTLSEVNQTAVNVTGISTTDRMATQITNNIINSDKAGATGFKFTTAGTGTLQFGANGIVFNGGNGTGFEFNLGGASDVVLDSNNVIDNAFGATGMLFDSIAAGSTVRFDSNAIQLLSTGLVVDRGIIFTSAGETVELQGTRNNTVTGATTDFSAPSGKTTGSFKLNGSSAP